MIRVQTVRVDGEETTWTVLGEDHLPFEPAELYLEHLRQTQSSPNTIRSYARALQLWLVYLHGRDREWDAYQLEDLTGFVAWMRSGLPPGVAPLHGTPSRVSDSTAALRLQGVRSFYVFHEWRGMRFDPQLFSFRDARSPYAPMLAHLRSRRAGGAVTVKVTRRRVNAPVLTPAQIDAIKNACGRFNAETGTWTGSVRDRFFFALLEETGLRMGEALSLQHRDWHSGSGASPFIEVVPRAHPHGARVKGGHYRKIYISDDLDSLYAEYLWQVCDLGIDLIVDDLDSSYVFVNLRGGERFAPIRPETIYKLVERIRRHLGDQVPARWSPHWFRHSHATAMLLAGRPIHVVSRRLGHSDIQTTLNTYAWVTEDDELRALADWRGSTSGWRDDEK
ncbi:Site-specific recombinase XerD [Plantibacter flavus]|uniref:Site-specific recombinase XerD n=1 Tax=Plantibacter flavus TaxID=150123 RepID=A0A3N2C6W4_9MICO|nr:site-specific recombinase XerD [Plantibacter flavus]SMG21882.1 Site-specific recombinase XerD [Plantibacter flavus]